MKVRFNWYTDNETLDMLNEMAATDDRKPSPWLTRMIKQEYAVFKREQRKKEVTT